MSKSAPRVKDVPRPLDYVICCIPAPAVPQLMQDCVASGVKVVHLFTAGLPVYPSIARAARAISHFLRYHETRAGPKARL